MLVILWFLILFLSIYFSIFFLLRERVNGFKIVNLFLKEVVFFEILKYSLVYFNICIVIIYLNILYKNFF